MVKGILRWSKQRAGNPPLRSRGWPCQTKCHRAASTESQRGGAVAVILELATLTSSSTQHPPAWGRPETPN